jgi:hypothetical protein
MADGSRNQAHAGFGGFSTHFGNDAITTVYFFSGSKFYVNTINAVNKSGSVFFSEIFPKMTPYLRGHDEFTITESAGAAQTANQVAGLTGYAGAAGITDRAFTPGYIFTFFYKENLQTFSLGKFQGGKNARRASTYYDYIIKLGHKFSFYRYKKPEISTYSSWFFIQPFYLDIDYITF